MVKEKVKFLASHNTYNIFDGDTSEEIGIAEEKIGVLTQVLRWFVSKQLMPTAVEVRGLPGNELIFTIRRGWYLFQSRVEVHDNQGEMIGYFKSKILSWSGGFYVYDKNDKQFAEVRGNFIGFTYRVLTPDHAVELGVVSKKWGGVVKELFTSADTYMVEVAEDLRDQTVAKTLVLAAALATDMIFKSESRTAGNDLLDLGG